MNGIDARIRVTDGERYCRVTSIEDRVLRFTETPFFQKDRPERTEFEGQAVLQLGGIAIERPVRLERGAEGWAVPADSELPAMIGHVVGAAAGDRRETLASFIDRFTHRGSGRPAWRKRSPRSSLVWAMQAVAAVALVAIIVGAVRENLFDLARTTGLVVAPTISLESPVTGTLVFLDEGNRITRGEPVAGMEGTSGRQVFLTAPASGTIVARAYRQGARVSRGKPILEIASDDKVSLRMFLPVADAFKVSGGARAQVSYLDGTRATYPVSLADMRWPDESALTRPGVRIDIPLTGNRAYEVGELVQVAFRPLDAPLLDTPLSNTPLPFLGNERN